MTIYFYSAECGDAARISFLDKAGNIRNIFVDSGYERTYRSILRNEINALFDAGEKIDLWVLTHDHDDHIGGALKYIRDIRTGFIQDIVKDWDCIALDDTLIRELPSTDISSAMSASQGNEIRDYIYSLKERPYSMPMAFHEKFIENFKLTFLSPTASSIDLIRKQCYKKDEAVVSMPMASTQSDYNQKLMKFDLTYQERDSNLLNLSSIAFIAEVSDQKMLWLADSHADSIVESLRLLGYSETNKLSCSVAKLSHHGSASNCSDELFSLLDCENYVISANGENIHNLPNKKCIARLLRNEHRGDKHYNIYFTYDNDIIKSIFENEDLGIYEELDFSIIFPKKGENFLCVRLND